MKAPYYIVPDVEEYRRLSPQSEEARKLSRKIAANIGDYASLRLILGIDPPEFAKFYPDMEITTPSTFDTIDTFLEKFGGNIPAGEYVPGEEQTEVAEQREETKSEDIPDLKTLIKDGHYQRALEFIEHQNLNNPRKSIYFAHQIRFLKKLVAIENYRNEMKG